MYLVSIFNDGVQTEIHGYKTKLSSGKVVQGINAINSFTFSINPKNNGFHRLREYKTLVKVYNTNKHRYEFCGRVLCPTDGMDENGFIKKDVVCECYLGYLCDSQQSYVSEKNWTVNGLVSHIVNEHNSQVETEKQIVIRSITVTDPNDNVYIGIQRENSWETLKKVIDKLGGEIRIEEVNGVLYLDYLKEIGETKKTEIALSKNMKSIQREKDPTAFITRLIPLGAKLGDDTEERLGIGAVNGGLPYIDDTKAIAAYGIHVGYVEFDDVTEAANLLTKARKWLTENNKVQVKYSITALDLSLRGKDIDDFEVHNRYPVKNALLGINDTARVIKKNIDICEEIKSTIEIGDNFKTLTDIQKEEKSKLKTAAKEVAKIVGDYVTNQKLATKLTEERAYTTSLISQTAGDITLSVSGEGAAAKISASLSDDSSKKIISIINLHADEITLEAKKSIIKSDYISISGMGELSATNVDITGKITATSGNFGKIELDASGNAFLKGNTVQGVYQEMSLRYDGLFCSTASYGQQKISLEGSSTDIVGTLTGTWRSTEEISVTSDRTKKHDIEDLSARYSVLFDLLAAVRFKYNDSKADAYHTGFIAQDVKKAIEAAGLTAQDFGAFVDTNGEYSLRYGEFIALCVHEIQNLKKRVKQLEGN